MVLDFDPICKDNIHWKASDKESSDDCLLKKLELVTWIYCIYIYIYIYIRLLCTTVFKLKFKLNQPE